VAPIDKTAQLLKSGNIIAIKGLGGFHLAVDATNETAVLELRKRKGREEKPLAIMVKDIGIARSICELSLEEEKTLLSFQHPIVLAYKNYSEIIKKHDYKLPTVKTNNTIPLKNSSY
jgi:hydrogenase maturation protein HypF